MTIYQKLIETPKKLFLIDSLGAILSVLLLKLVLPKFESFFGIPKTALNILALIAVFYFLFDFIAYCWSNKNTEIYLKVLALLNFIYCLISVGLAIYHKEHLTIFGWLYIIVEVIIILSLASLEHKVARAISPKSF